MANQDMHGPSGMLFQGGRRIDGVTDWVITVHDGNPSDWGGWVQLPQTRAPSALTLAPATIEFTDDEGRLVHGRVTVAACDLDPGDVWHIQVTGIEPLATPR